jgi:hypothetical protein
VCPAIFEIQPEKFAIVNKNPKLKSQVGAFLCFVDRHVPRLSTAPESSAYGWALRKRGSATPGICDMIGFSSAISSRVRQCLFTFRA